MRDRCFASSAVVYSQFSLTEIVLPIVNRDGRKLIGDNFIFQQDGATPHTADITMEIIINIGFSVIPSDKWPANSPDLNQLDYFFFGIRSIIDC